MLKSLNEEKTLVLGILGGGQLAKMLAIDAYKMGIEVAIIENGERSPAGDMTKFEFTGGWNNPSSLEKFIEASDIVTLENEFIDPSILEYIAKFNPVFPTPQTMKLVQDKFTQKTVFKRKRILVPPFAQIDSEEDALLFRERYGFPFVLKTRTLGYDGYGNYTVRNAEDIKIAFEKFTVNGQTRPLMAEQFIEFQKELAVMVARNAHNEIAVYPCVETVQKNHICHIVIAPAEVSKKIARKAQDLAVRCVEAINGIGVFGVELFYTNDGRVLVNEIAPRPHNSGHYTIEACHTSQYENAIRAVLGLPLGSTDMIAPYACMINLLGEREGSGIPVDVSQSLKVAGASLHLYNKKSSRIGRKMGHITALGKTRSDAYSKAKAAADSLVW